MMMSWRSAETVSGRILRLPLRLIPRGLVVPVFGGPNCGLQWVVGSGTHGCWLGTYEGTKPKRLAEALGPGKVFYDLGANVGYYTLLASRIVGAEGKVVSVEPLPRNVAFLRRHVDLNGCGNVQIIELAVSDRVGTAHFSGGAHPSMAQLLRHGALTVQTGMIDSLVREMQVPPPDVIKMDIEGAEARAIKGGWETLARHHPLLFLSTHGEEIHRESCSLLRELGYELEALDGGAPDRASELLAKAS